MARIRKETTQIAFARQALWLTAIYIRLSREDGNDESYSVTNQKQRLKAYFDSIALEEVMVLVDIYVDARHPQRNEALNLTHQLVVDMQRLLSLSAERARRFLDRDSVNQLEQRWAVEFPQAHLLPEQGDELRNIPRGGFQRAHGVF